MTRTVLESHARVVDRWLSFVMPADRAAAVAGDLAESATSRLDLWTSAAGLGLGLIGRAIGQAPLRMAAVALVGWFGYMALGLAFTFVGVVVVALDWRLVGIVHDHTALELLTSALGVAVPPPPRMLELAFWLQTLAMWSVAPYHTVRIAARWWKGREVPLAVAFSAVWAVLSYVVPFVILPGAWSPGHAFDIMVGTTATPLAVPLMTLFVILGGLRERQASLAPRA